MIRAFLGLISAIIFLILMIPVLLVEQIIRLFNPSLASRSMFRLVQGYFKVLSFICSVHLVIRGLDRVPKNQAVLYIANHSSIFDVVLSYAHLPGLTGFISKDSIAKVPVMNIIMKQLYCLFLDRSDIKAGLKMILTAIDYVKSGVSIFIFPEGTRTKDGNLNEFHAGSFKIATKANCPIVPVAITNSASIIRNHIPFVKTSTVILDFGEPIFLDTLSPEQKKTISNDTKQRIAAMLKEDAIYFDEITKKK